MKRRSAIKNMTLGVVALGATHSCKAQGSDANTDQGSGQKLPLKGNIKHSVSQWCYGYLSIEELCKELDSMGVGAIDLVGEANWPILKKYGIDCSMCNGAELNLIDGFCDSTFHDQLESRYKDLIPKVAAAGYQNLITFSGNRRGISDEAGLANCVVGLKKILPTAEAHGVTLQMELLNSKVDHKDYMCDNTPWGVALVKALGSDHFKLLYDIYHMQIMEGDVIRTIKDNHQYFGHYHTAGNPGRNELDENQELYYPAICKAIVETGFKGYLAQEFIPRNEDKIQSLRDAFTICDV